MDGSSRVAGRSLRRWPMSAFPWGDAMCEAPGCTYLAELMVDYDDYDLSGVPLCLECGELAFDRQAAVLLGATGLPDLWESRGVGSVA